MSPVNNVLLYVLFNHIVALKFRPRRGDGVSSSLPELERVMNSQTTGGPRRIHSLDFGPLDVFGLGLRHTTCRFVLSKAMREVPTGTLLWGPVLDLTLSGALALDCFESFRSPFTPLLPS